MLAEHGGVIVHDSAKVEAIGCIVGQVDERPMDALLAR